MICTLTFRISIRMTCRMNTISPLSRVIADLDLPVVNDSISKESHKDLSQGFESPNHQEPNTETIDDPEDTGRSMELMPQKSLFETPDEGVSSDVSSM